MLLAGNTVEKVTILIKPEIERLGLKLWDVRFVKEGASWYLRIFIDKDGGISIDDCTEVSHAIDPILDENDPIEASYFLEVCSPGLDRELTRKEHYIELTGKNINVTLYKAVDGSKSFTGKLTGYSDGPDIEIDGQSVHFTQSSISKARLCDDE